MLRSVLSFRRFVALPAAVQPFAVLLRQFSTSSTDGATAASSASSSSTSQDETTHFGFKTVPKTEKAKLVGEVFHRVASSYDVMNDLMSVGIHRVWKEQFVGMLYPTPGMQVLDVAGGTGDIAFRVYESMRSLSPAPALSLSEPPTSKIIVSDINPSMLAVGKDRAIARGYLDKDGNKAQHGIDMEFIVGDAQKLPFADNSFDAYTIAFGLRNVTQTDLALKEALRVLRKGGRFMCLEFSHVHPLLQPAYDAYSFNVIPALGQVVANDRDSYQYLVESIRNFPNQEDLATLMRDVGFKGVTYTNFSFGIAAVHSGFKL